MWTPENRPLYNRDHLRYPSDLTDGEWALVEPLLPPAWSTRLTLAEPISRREDFEVGTCRLLADLTESLLASGRGARRSDSREWSEMVKGP